MSEPEPTAHSPAARSRRRTSIRVLTRGYEMCSDRYISVTAVARYLEHVRWTSISDSDFGPAGFGVRGVIRAQRIELLRAPSFHVELDVTTVLGRVGRTSFDYVHEIRGAARGDLLGRGEATIVALGADGPTPVDARMAEWIEADPKPGIDPPGERPGSDPSHLETIVVRPSDQDVLQHVNHARYLDYVTDALVLADRAGALGPGTPSRSGVRAVSIAYDDQAVLGDVVEAALWPVAPREVHVELRRARDGRRLTRARLWTGLVAD